LRKENTWIDGKAAGQIGMAAGLLVLML